MHSELKLQYYRTVLTQTKRGNGRGRIINAKPIFLVALFEYIERGFAHNNKILFDSELKKCYENHYSLYEPEKQATPFCKPFFYLQSDGYWQLTWNNNIEKIIVSAKFLRENVKYASLDNALWDLLQNAEARNILREAVINYFLIPKNKSTI
jgi:putative restriction endonuclease